MNECQVKIMIHKGQKAIPRRFFINDIEIPHVARVEVVYAPNDIRRVIFGVYATDVIEIEEE